MKEFDPTRGDSIDPPGPGEVSPGSGDVSRPKKGKRAKAHIALGDLLVARHDNTPGKSTSGQKREKAEPSKPVVEVSPSRQQPNLQDTIADTTETIASKEPETSRVSEQANSIRAEEMPTDEAGRKDEAQGVGYEDIFLRQEPDVKPMREIPLHGTAETVSESEPDESVSDRDRLHDPEPPVVRPAATGETIDQQSVSERQDDSRDQEVRPSITAPDTPHTPLTSVAASAESEMVPPFSRPKNPEVAWPFDDRELGPPGEPLAPIAELADDIPEPALPIVESGTIAWDPAAAYRRYRSREDAARNDYVSTDEVVTKQELDDAVYYAARSAHGRGLVAGLFLGGMYEHFKHRRREKKAEKQRQRNQRKQLSQVREDQHFYFAGQAKQQTEHERRLTTVERRATTAEEQLRAYRVLQRGANEREQASVQREPGSRQQFETPQQSPEPDVPEQLSIPPEHELRTSAWLRAELDRRTGRLVENPTLTYGHEYHHERAPESGSITQRNAATGEVALVAAARAATNAGGIQDTSGTVPIGPIPSATTQGPPPRAKQKTKVANIRDQLTNSTRTGPLWPYLVALVVILFCLVLLV